MLKRPLSMAIVPFPAESVECLKSIGSFWAFSYQKGLGSARKAVEIKKRRAIQRDRL